MEVVVCFEFSQFHGVTVELFFNLKINKEYVVHARTLIIIGVVFLKLAEDIALLGSASPSKLLSSQRYQSCCDVYEAGMQLYPCIWLSKMLVST